MKSSSVPTGALKWREQYLSYAFSKKLRKRLPPNQCDVLYVLSHTSDLGLLGYFYTYRIEGSEETHFLHRNAVNILINKGLVFRPAARRALPQLTDAGRELFNDVTGFDATTSLDTPSDAPTVSQRGFARSFQSMSADHMFRFLVALQRVAESNPDAQVRDTPQGVNMIAAKDWDPDTKACIAEYCYDVRVYYDTVNYRVLKSSDYRALCLGADVCRIAFRPLKTSKRHSSLPDEEDFNFPIPVVRAALADEKVQVCLQSILKAIEPTFEKLLLQYPPPVESPAPTYAELAAENARLKAEIARLTTPRIADTVST